MAELHARRRAQLAARLAAQEVAAALITELVNVRYLTGLASSNAALLITAEGQVTLATDVRYATAAEQVAPDVELVVIRGVAVELANRAAAAGAKRIAVEAHNMTLELFESVRSELRDSHTDVELTHLGRQVEELRVVKDDTELDALRRACEISSQALDALLSAGGLLGRTEMAIGRDLEWRMYELGADGLAFETIVAAGANSAVPHHRPTETVVQRGDFLKIDFGATYRGYHADCTRTCVVGAAPADWQREIYDLVAAGQRAGCDALKPGDECIAVDKAAHEVIDNAGYKENFGHGTGHGVGLNVHEGPTLGYSATGTLVERMTVTVEPGIYLPGRGGVRIEDTLVVWENGPELLTPLTKELLVIDA